MANNTRLCKTSNDRYENMMRARRNFLRQLGAGVVAGWIVPGLAVVGEKPARKRIKR